MPSASKVMCDASVRFQRERARALRTHPHISPRGASGWRRDQAIAKARARYLSTLRKVSPLTAQKSR